MRGRPARTRHARREAERKGRRGETIAVLLLWATGWRILGRRVATPRGEVDIVARRGRTLCFVEVKWRASAAGRDGAISTAALTRVAAAAEALAPRWARPGDTVRIDVVLAAPGAWPRRIVNAWQPLR